MDLLQLINDKIDANHKSTEKRLDKIDANQLAMNKDLEKHMSRSDFLEKMHGENKVEIDEGKVERGKNSADIEELKKPVEARKYIMQTVKGVTAICALVLIGLRLAGKI